MFAHVSKHADLQDTRSGSVVSSVQNVVFDNETGSASSLGWYAPVEKGISTTVYSNCVSPRHKSIQMFVSSAACEYSSVACFVLRSLYLLKLNLRNVSFK